MASSLPYSAAESGGYIRVQDFSRSLSETKPYYRGYAVLTCSLLTR
jgi:hypothetical protein